MWYFRKIFHPIIPPEIKFTILFLYHNCLFKAIVTLVACCTFTDFKKNEYFVFFTLKERELLIKCTLLTKRSGPKDELHGTPNLTNKKENRRLYMLLSNILENEARKDIDL